MSVDNPHDVEAIEEASEAISKQEGRGAFLLWFAILGSPLAWAGHLAVNYSLEEWFACAPSTEEEGHVLGLTVHTFSILFNTAMAAVAALSGLVAYSCWKKLRARARNDDQGDDEVDDNRSERARWMAFAGIVECALFLGIILLGYLPSFMLNICENTP